MPREPKPANAACSRSLKAFVVAVDVLALVSILALASTGGLLERPVTLLMLLALAAAVGARPIHLPRLEMRIVAADVFILFALLALAPAAAPLVAVAGMLGASASRGARFRSIKTAFNLGAVPLSMAAGVGAFLALGGAAAGLTAAVLPLLAAALVYTLVNVVLTATVVHLGSGRNWFEICRQSVVLASVSHVTSAMLSAALLLVWSVAGPAGLLLGLIPLIPLQQYHRSQAQPRDERPADSTVLRELSEMAQDETGQAERPSAGSTPPDPRARPEP